MNAKQTKPAASGKKIRVTLVKGLGLRHRQHTVEVEDTPSVRGMINKVSYLVKVEG